MRSRFAFQESSDWGWQPQVFPDELTAATLPCSLGANLAVAGRANTCTGTHARPFIWTE